MKAKILQILILSCLVFMVQAENSIDEQRPDNVSDKMWSSLTSAIQEAKLLPTPVGIGGQNSQFGQSVSVDGDRALIGGPNMAGSGVVYVMDYDGSNWNETTVLKPTDGEPGDQFGYSVSLSGSRAVIGAFTDNNAVLNTGSAYIYDYDGSSWSLMQKLIVGDATADDSFGYSVSLSGNKALIGAPYDDNNGSAYVYDYDGANWSLQQKLVATGGRFGYSVSLSGNRALIGAYQENNAVSNTGSAYVYDFDGTIWSLNQKIFAADGAAGDSFGYSLSLSGDRALIGAPFDDDGGSQSGSAYVYDYDGSDWLLDQKLTANDAVAGDIFGHSVGLSGDRVLIGAYGNDDGGSQSGSAYVYDYDGSNWALKQKIIAADGSTSDQFGYSVSLSGNRTLIGARFDDDVNSDSGSAYVYDYDNVDWSLNQKLAGADGAAIDNYGVSVSLSGNRALVGAFGGDQGSTSPGSAYVYDYDGANWSLNQKLVAAIGTSDNGFGYSVSLSGDRALIGAYGNVNDLGFVTGSAYVYDYDGSSWSLNQNLFAPDGAAYDGFGSSVSLLGNRVLIGAPNDDDAGSSSGSAYVFDYDGVNWSLNQKLFAADGAWQDKFGWSVSLSGDRVLIGAPEDDDMGSNSGSAYVYDYDGSIWSLNQKLVATDGTMFGSFGSSVSLSADRVLIGAYRDNNQGIYFGSAYIYGYDGSSWSLEQKLIADDSTDGDYFGFSVSLSGNKALIGAYQDDDVGPNSGSAYVYEYDGSSWLQDQKLLADDGATGDRFGYSVSLSNDKVLIGASKDNDQGTASGSAYVINIADTFEVSVNVSGLAFGNSIELLNNGGDNILVETDSIATFATVLYDGDDYNVTVNLPQPTDPNQFCVVINPMGSISGADVQLDVTCTTNKYNIGVTVTGLDVNNSIDLTTNGQSLPFSSNTTANFPNSIEDGTAYAVLLTANPTAPNQTCTVTGGNGFLNNGSGTIVGGPVAIEVLCITNQYSIGGIISGLATDNEVILQNNNGDDLLVSTNAPFTFDNMLDDESNYAVSVLTNPSTPNQTCTVTGGDDNDGTGALSGNNETSIVVTCLTIQYDVNINLAGLAATNTVSFANGFDDLDISNDGVFNLSILDDESHFDVSITAQPETPNQLCSFETANVGDLAGANVQINVNCFTDQHSVGVLITGLASSNSVVLSNNGELLTAFSNGSHTFINKIDDGSDYVITVVTQPITPNQTCSITGSASGTINAADVLGIEVDCVTNSYFIGGEVTGLLVGNYLVLQNNNGDDKIISANGAYVFTTPLLDQQSYDISINLQPNNPIQPCTVSNGDSELAGEDVINVDISCLIGDDLIYRHGFELEQPNQ